MIIRSSKQLKNYKNTQLPISKEPVIEEIAIVKEEIKSNLNNEVIQKKKNNKKVTPAPAIEKSVEEVIEEEKIDVSEWLKEDTEE